MSNVHIKFASDIDGLKKAETISVQNVSTEVSIRNLSKAVSRAGVALSELSREIHLSMRVHRDALRSLGLFHPTAYISGYRIVNKRGRNKLVPINKNFRG